MLDKINPYYFLIEKNLSSSLNALDQTIYKNDVRFFLIKKIQINNFNTEYGTTTDYLFLTLEASNICFISILQNFLEYIDKLRQFEERLESVNKSSPICLSPFLY